MSSVFEAKSYRGYLEAWLESQPQRGRGLRSRMAEVIGTQTGFITQVFQGAAEFSLEQGLKIAHWIGLDGVTKEFFLLLLQRDRAGTPELRAHFQTLMARILESRRDLSQRLDVKTAPSELDQATYFSSWVYAAVHVALTCEGLDSAERIADHLRLPLAVVRKALEFLLQAGLATEDGGRLRTGEARMHLGTTSPHLLKHHLNWNLRAMHALEADLAGGLHYSSVVSLSKDDIEKLRELLTEALNRSKKIIRDSPGEEVCGLTVNLFALRTH